MSLLSSVLPRNLRRRSHRHSPLTSSFCTLSRLPELPLSYPTYIVWGSNTGLGKTLVSAGIAFSYLLTSPAKFLYLKPIQTGFPSDSDSRFVYTKLSALFSRRNPSFALHVSNHVINASVPAANAFLKTEESRSSEIGMTHLGWCEEKSLGGCGNGNGVSELICKTMYSWEEAVSPHLAAERESGAFNDSEILEMLGRSLTGEVGKEGSEMLCVVETAGGVASPGPSGSLQCDLYRPFRLPAVLVGDGRLGGISGTISAYESLKLRGYDVVAVILEDHGLGNEVPLLSYLRNKVPVLVMPPVPKDLSDDLMEWFNDSHDMFSSLKEILLSSYSERIRRLYEMPKRAREIFWWPFTQHKLVSEEAINVIDSRSGENFAIFKAQNNNVMTPLFDACASWWTQGPDATMQTELARDMGYAAARFGHVMFPENVYDPVLECAELLLEGVGKGWASRTYFSDNGSTAIEIALKMAFRKFSLDHGLIPNFPMDDTNARSTELMVLALKGSYHGDTLGAMEAQAPSSYTGFLQQPWYTGRGLFLDPPTVFMRNKMWVLSLPAGLNPKTVTCESIAFGSHDEIIHQSRDKSELSVVYRSFISEQLSEQRGSICIGALIMEPVIQAAGGMRMVDPLFQRILVKECQSRKIPVILDEVFTGFWRLGTETAAELINCVPDIACFGKLMTGGIVPLAVTLATDAVFNAFFGDSKLKALLHGHSYSAHALGCTAAAKSMRWFKDPDTNPNIIPERMVLRELWDGRLVQQISSHPAVDRVVPIGTLCALELRADGNNAGYASLYAKSLLENLREDGVYTRPLGNVIYLMCGPSTSPATCGELLIKLHRRLEEFIQTAK